MITGTFYSLALNIWCLHKTVLSRKITHSHPMTLVCFCGMYAYTCLQGSREKPDRTPELLGSHEGAGAGPACNHLMTATQGNYRPLCLIGTSHHVWEVMSWYPVAALRFTPPSGSSQDLFLYISFTTRVPPSDFPGCSSFSVCSHLEIASQILKRQRSKVRKAPCAESKIQPELDSSAAE